MLDGHDSTINDQVARTRQQSNIQREVDSAAGSEVGSLPLLTLVACFPLPNLFSFDLVGTRLGNELVTKRSTSLPTMQTGLSQNAIPLSVLGRTHLKGHHLTVSVCITIQTGRAHNG
jgi:hypothetical protein